MRRLCRTLSNHDHGSDLESACRKRKRKKVANENAALEILVRRLRRRLTEMLPDVLQKVQVYAVRHVVFSVAQTVKLMQVSKMFQAEMLPNVLMHLAKHLANSAEILSEQNQTDVAVAAVVNTATFAVVAKKKSPTNLHADKYFTFPRHFSSECCNDVRRSAPTSGAKLDGTPRPKLKCMKCKKVHHKWIMLPEH